LQRETRCFYFIFNLKLMKKLVPVIFGLFIVLSLSACGTTSTDETMMDNDSTMIEESKSDDAMMESTETTEETMMEEKAAE